MVVVALPDDERGFAGFVVRRALTLSGPVVWHNIGILLLPEQRGQGLGSSAQCQLTDYLFPRRLPNCTEVARPQGELCGNYCPVTKKCQCLYIDQPRIQSLHARRRIWWCAAATNRQMGHLTSPSQRDGPSCLGAGSGCPAAKRVSNQDV